MLIFTYVSKTIISTVNNYELLTYLAITDCDSINDLYPKRRTFATSKRNGLRG